ncbi:MAG: BatD family protein [Steroidobacteraceae bacterium]
MVVRRLGGASLGLLLALVSLPAGAAMRASLDSNMVSPGDSVQLTLQLDGETGTRPDLAPLQRDFDVLGTSRTTTVQILNGSTTSQTQERVTLSAKHAGRLTIPSIIWNGERSAPLTLDVSASAGGSASSGSAASQTRQVFLETQFGPAAPYVQAAVSVTVRLYTSEALYDPRLSLASDGDLLVRQVGPDESGTVQRGGRTYEVVTRHYVVFPQRSGHLTLPGAVLDARVAASSPTSAQGNAPFGSFFSSTPFFGNVFSTNKPIRVHGDPISLDVAPRPSGAVGSYWLPATGVTLKSVWHPAALSARAGDPVTVDLSLEAVGLTAAQVPDLAQLLALPRGLESYPDEPTLANAARGDTVVGTRKQSIAFIADRPGHFTIPALKVAWWDTRTDQPREADLPARTLTILPAVGGAQPSQSAVARAGVPVGVAGRAAATSAGAAVAAAAAGQHQHAASGAPGAQQLPTAAVMPAGRDLAAYSPTRRAWLWLALSVALALAWLLTLVAWLRLRQRLWQVAPTEPSASPASRALLVPRALAAYRVSSAAAGHSSPLSPQTPSGRVAARAGAEAARTACRLACKRNDAAEARRHLLTWIAAEWRDEAPRGLNALARHVDDPSLAALLRDLDRACYTGQPWSGEMLGAALGTLPRAARSEARRASGLTPLYPSD